MPLRTLRITNSDDITRLDRWLTGRHTDAPEVETRVRDILAAVRERGDAAVVEYTRQFDCPEFTPQMLRVAPQAMADAVDEVPPADLEIIAEAASNIRAYHEKQLQQSWWSTSPDGTVLGQLVRPVDRAGLYMPGGTGGEVPLISSLLMNVIPAQVAGVGQIALATPPRKDGTANPYILAAAHLLRLDELYLMGSAWAVAALAFGTSSIPAVDVIAGPGNIYVTTAKRLVMGQVGIDMLAGPSEIAVLADTSADPRWLAADLLSQAEHDTLASALLITADEQLGKAVKVELVAQLDSLPRAETARTSLEDWGAVILVDGLNTGLEVINRVAPEHLELAVADPWPLLGRIRNAGAIFLGNHCPEPVGDYFAGPNHVLPTMRTARFSSPLSVETFVKKSSLIATSCAYVTEHAPKIARFARLEGLEAHARSAEIRTKQD